MSTEVHSLWLDGHINERQKGNHLNSYMCIMYVVL